jgi:hypothetical protein
MVDTQPNHLNQHINKLLAFPRWVDAVLKGYQQHSLKRGYFLFILLALFFGASLAHATDSTDNQTLEENTQATPDDTQVGQQNNNSYSVYRYAITGSDSSQTLGNMGRASITDYRLGSDMATPLHGNTEAQPVYSEIPPVPAKTPLVPSGVSAVSGSTVQSVHDMSSGSEGASQITGYYNIPPPYGPAANCNNTVAVPTPYISSQAFDLEKLTTWPPNPTIETFNCYGGATIIQTSVTWDQSKDSALARTPVSLPSSWVPVVAYGPNLTLKATSGSAPTNTGAAITILAGDTINLIWSSPGASSCSASWLGSCSSPTGGSTTVQPTKTTSYIMTSSAALGTGSGMTSTATVTATVDQPIIASLTASVTTIAVGGSSTLSWSVSDPSNVAVTCTAQSTDGSWSGTLSNNSSAALLSGQSVVKPLATTGNVTYTMTCKDSLQSNVSTTAVISVGSSGQKINGACGAANGVDAFSAPTTSLCGAGTASSVSGSGPWSWSCSGSNGGSTASCYDLLEVNGVCGSANGANALTIPVTGLCNIGTPSLVTGSGPWSWSCSGSNGGSTASCYDLLEVNGACGTSANTCTSGSPSNEQDNGINTTWSCLGSHGGTTNNSCTVVDAPLTTSVPCLDSYATGGTVCPEVPLQSADGLASGGWHGYADPTIRATPGNSSLIWLGYSYLYTTSYGSVNSSSCSFDGIDTDFVFSSDGGSVWQTPLISNSPIANQATLLYGPGELDPEPSSSWFGNPAWTHHEVMNLRPQVYNSQLYWWAFHSQYLTLPLNCGSPGGDEKPSKRWSFTVAPADANSGPSNITNSTATFYGEPITDGSVNGGVFPYAQNLADPLGDGSYGSGELSGCTEFYEPALLVAPNAQNESTLYLFLDCTGTSLPEGQQFYTQFSIPANPTALTASTQWTYTVQNLPVHERFAGLNDVTNIVQNNSYFQQVLQGAANPTPYITQMDIAPSYRNPSVTLAIFSIAYNESGGIGKIGIGCVAAPLATISPPSFMRDSNNNIVVEAWWTSTDSGWDTGNIGGPDACTYDPNSATGLMMVHKDLDQPYPNDPAGKWADIMETFLQP